MIDASSAANLTITVVSSDVNVLLSYQNIYWCFPGLLSTESSPHLSFYRGPLLLGASARAIVDASSAEIDTGSLRIQ